VGERPNTRLYVIPETVKSEVKRSFKQRSATTNKIETKILDPAGQSLRARGHAACLSPITVVICVLPIRIPESLTREFTISLTLPLDLGIPAVHARFSSPLSMPRISKHLECLSLDKLFVSTSAAISLVGVNSTLNSPLLRTSLTKWCRTSICLVLP